MSEQQGHNIHNDEDVQRITNMFAEATGEAVIPSVPEELKGIVESTNANFTEHHKAAAAVGGQGVGPEHNPNDLVARGYVQIEKHTPSPKQEHGLGLIRELASSAGEAFSGGIRIVEETILPAPLNEQKRGSYRYDITDIEDIVKKREEELKKAA